ncbi:MAG: DUF3817 domain-containing protein [Gammaproteobacteria bacterium]|nr:DUF3817 domain-containing protein [Gammaproteobacteria bacterium]
MLKTFRTVSFIEGVSLIALLLIAMPAKYYFGYFDVIFPVGITHGVLWMLYFVLSLMVSHKYNWSIAFWLLTLLVSVVPFSCFILERKLKTLSVK